MQRTPVQEKRLYVLKRMEQGRTDPQGKALPGYRRNVEMIRQEIAELEQLDQRKARLA